MKSNNAISQPVHEGQQCLAYPQSTQPVSTVGHTESLYATLNPAFSPAVTPCPACQQMGLETAYQMPMVAARAGYTLCHCRNPECAGYGMTMRLEVFLEKYGAK